MNILLQEPRIYIMDITHEKISLGIVVGEQQDGKLFLSNPLFVSSMTLVAIKPSVNWPNPASHIAQS
jgi:hypothetical protein